MGFIPVYKIKDMESFSKLCYQEYLQPLHELKQRGLDLGVKKCFFTKGNLLFINANELKRKKQYCMLHLLSELEKNNVIELYGFLNMNTMDFVGLDSLEGRMIHDIFNGIKHLNITLNIMLMTQGRDNNLYPYTLFDVERFFRLNPRPYPVVIEKPSLIAVNKSSGDKIYIVQAQVIPRFIPKLYYLFRDTFDKSKRIDYLQVSETGNHYVIGMLKHDSNFFKLSLEGIEDGIESEIYPLWLLFLDYEYQLIHAYDNKSLLSRYIKNKFKRKPYISKLIASSLIFGRDTIEYDVNSQKIIAYDNADKTHSKIELGSIDKEYKNINLKYITLESPSSMTVLMNTVTLKGANWMKTCSDKIVTNTNSLIELLNSKVECNNRIDKIEALLLKVGLPDLDGKLKPVWFPIYMKIQNFPNEGKTLILHHRRVLSWITALTALSVKFNINNSLLPQLKKFIKVKPYGKYDNVELMLSFPELTYNFSVNNEFSRIDDYVVNYTEFSMQRVNSNKIYGNIDYFIPVQFNLNVVVRR